ncbi:hypothetical protein BU24DRAFT_1989 [Aaosphaeria arxii CBS 175.79]|uniref:Uncharacterized protein n=1 Tax=Aaosphaeria arxii CBS 175.79 TaxID=1450172 RepID=A0A6A5Y4K2_9PLEO|nr:uncharacterized protein BU24DRAFT_1989 [Aaosphaeria arxii CBS 175.79]KAF2020482.1 hypothetical protein BU24DRAFT_1989 [Aaosphaeria arxii CBS 175.79]
MLCHAMLYYASLCYTIHLNRTPCGNKSRQDLKQIDGILSAPLRLISPLLLSIFLLVGNVLLEKETLFGWMFGCCYSVRVHGAIFLLRPHPHQMRKSPTLVYGKCCRCCSCS